MVSHMTEARNRLIVTEIIKDSFEYFKILHQIKSMYFHLFFTLFVIVLIKCKQIEK